MNQCVIITNYVTNNYRKRLLESHIEYFNNKSIDVILCSAEHMQRFAGVKNYITISYPPCDKKFISEKLYYHFITDDYKKFYSAKHYDKIDTSNYFVKLFTAAFSYCHALGYEFAYVMDFDCVFNKKYIDDLLDTPRDTSKIYFYPFDIEALAGSFFFTNIQKFLEVFSQENLDNLESAVKEKSIQTGEHALYELLHDNPNLILLRGTMYDVFDKFNMFSSRNVADIYHDGDSQSYIFLFAKGDPVPNEFACELLLDGDVIFTRASSHYGDWQYFFLLFDREYCINYYDSQDMNSDTLHRTKTIYTSSKEVTVNNWSQWINH